MKVALGLISRSHYYEVWTASWRQHQPPPPLRRGEHAPYLFVFSVRQHYNEQF